MKVKIAQSCPNLGNLRDYTVHRILQARILEWVTFPFSRGSSHPRDWTQVSRIAGRFFTSWATREAQEYWSGSPIPSPVDLSDPGIEPGSPILQSDSLLAEPQGKAKNTGVGSLSLLQQIFLTQDRTQVFCIASGFFTNWSRRTIQKMVLMTQITMIVWSLT